MGSELVQRFAQGEPGAVRDLYQRFGRPVFTVAYSALRDRGLAEEATQLTFLRAWQAAGRFDTSRELGPWLYAIARRVAVDVYRRERRHLGRLQLDSETDIAVLSESFEQTWESWQIRLALESMPAAQREVVRAIHFEGLTHAETARRLGISLGTVKSRSSRAYRRLAAQLGHLDEASA